MNSINKTARVAGFLYLLLLPLSICGIMYGRAGLLVPGDALATAHNILASETLVRFSIVSAFLAQIVNILVVLLLYQLLKSVSPNMGVLMVVFFLVGVPIAMLNELNRIAMLLLLDGTATAGLVPAGQAPVLVPFLLNLHEQGIQIASIFWGLWLLPMGYLVFRAGFLPRILGVLLIIGGMGYLAQSLAVFLVPDYTGNIAMFTAWGEVLFPLWLLIKGVNADQWGKRAFETGIGNAPFRA